MGKLGYVTIPVKIPKQLKKLLDKYGIKPGPIIRKALQEEVKRRILREIAETASQLSDAARSIPDEETARLIREDREAR